MNYAFIRKEILSDPPSVSTVAGIFTLDIISLVKYEGWELKLPSHAHVLSRTAVDLAGICHSPFSLLLKVAEWFL